MNKLNWWLKFRLLFCKSYYAADIGSGDYDCMLTFKTLNGTIYIVKEEYKGGQ